MLQGINSNMGHIIPRDPKDYSVREVIKTQNGTIVTIPVMLGSETNVKPLKDGTYKVTTQAVCMPKPEPVVKIMTEDELIAKYGPKTGKNLQVVA